MTTGTAPEGTAFEEFHARRHRQVLQYARVVIGGDGAEDACQEAWLRAWRSWGTADPDRLDAWMTAIVRNCCFDRLGRAPKTIDFSGDPVPLKEPVTSFEDHVVASLELVEAWTVLAKLPRPLREVLWLREVMDLSYAQIAEVQDVPLGTVMSRLHSARQKAQRALRRRGAR